MNASGGSAAFLAAALASSYASVFFALSICWTMKVPFDAFILDLTCYYLGVYLQNEKLTPIACNLQRPSSTASYSAMLLHLSDSAMNCRRVAYLNSYSRR
jgi:hypothetical protein